MEGLVAITQIFVSKRLSNVRAVGSGMIIANRYLHVHRIRTRRGNHIDQSTEYDDM